MSLFRAHRNPFADRESRMRGIPFAVLLTGLLLSPLGMAAAAEFEIGASLGAARSTIGGNSPPASSFAPLLVGSAGVAISYRMTQSVSLLLEPGYSMRGAKLTVEELEDSDKRDVLEIRLPYVVLPAGIRVASSGGRGFVVGGLDLRWLQKAEAKLLAAPGGTVDITDNVSSFDVAMNIGAGYAFPWHPVRISLELRYSQGLLNLDKGVSESVDAPLPLRFRTTGMGLLVRCMVPLHIGKERG
jgi:hypothetical protein